MLALPFNHCIQLSLHAPTQSIVHGLFGAKGAPLLVYPLPTNTTQNKDEQKESTNRV